MGGAPGASARASSGLSSDQQAPRLSLAHTSHDGFSRSRGMAGGTRKVRTAGDEQTASGPRSVRRFIVPSEVTGLQSLSRSLLSNSLRLETAGPVSGVLWLCTKHVMHSVYSENTGFHEPSVHPRSALATLGTLQTRRLSGS